MVGTNDLEASTKFYDAVLDTLGLTRGLTDTDYIGYGSKTSPENIEFYLTKPFDPEELLLRINNILKRTNIPKIKAHKLISFGSYQWDNVLKKLNTLISLKTFQ